MDFVKCEGEFPDDKDALKGILKVLPKKEGFDNAAGIPLRYFPFTKNRKDRNESPLVAIQFDGLENMNGTHIGIICKAYYEGVVHSKKDKAGLVKFEIVLDHVDPPVE